MSVKAMGAVWDLELPRDEKLVLLAYADHADHDGRNVYPSVDLIARKAGYSEASIHRILRRLKKSGLLIEDGKGPRGTIRYRLGGAILTPSEGLGVSSVTPGGVIAMTEGGVVAVTPEPSLTISKDSLRGRAEETARHRALFTAVSKTCKADPKTARSSIGKVASILEKAGYTPEDVAAFEKWWWGNKGMRQRPPKVWDVQAQIGVIRAKKEEDKPKDYFVPPSMRVT